MINGKQSYDATKVYACCCRGDRGGTVCASTLRREVGQVDSAVLDWVRREVLTEEYVAAIITEARRRVAGRASTQAADIDQLERQAARLCAKVDNFAELALEAPTGIRNFKTCGWVG